MDTPPSNVLLKSVDTPCIFLEKRLDTLWKVLDKSVNTPCNLYE